MNINILIFVEGLLIGLIIGLFLWLKSLSDSITEFDLEIAKIKSALDVLKEVNNERH